LRDTTHEIDVGGNLFDLVLASPQTAYWANAASASDFLIQAIKEFGIDAHRVNLWHSMADSHVGFEYESFVFGKPVFYDPLYGVLLINAAGVPASVNDLLSEFAGHGFD